LLFDRMPLLVILGVYFLLWFFMNEGIGI